MAYFPNEILDSIAQQSMLIAEKYIDSGIVDPESLESVITQHTFFFKHCESFFVAEVAICFFMNDFISKITSARQITEDEYTNLCIDNFDLTNHLN